MPRLFVAIDLPETIKNQVLELTRFGMRGVKWVNLDQFHLSLRFIGEVDQHSFESIKTCLSKIRGSTCNLTLNGIGTFPMNKNPRVIWTGVEKNELLGQVRNKVEHQLSQIGISSERRKYHPHVTLGRVKENKIKGLGDYVAQYALFRSETFLVDNFVLFSSKLTPKGAIYTKEMTYPLDKK